MRASAFLSHWRDRLRPTSLRQTLVMGLAPGLVVVVILAIVAWYAVNEMAAANAELAETGWELATTRALQLNFQQTLIPFNNQIVARGQHNSPVLFTKLANDLEQLFQEAGPIYEEAKEQRLITEAHFRWQIVRTRAEALLQMSPQQFAQAQVEGEIGSVQADSQYVWQQLEQLHEVVFAEMQDSVRASQSARNVAIGLILASSLGALALGAIFVFVFAGYITRPLAALEAGAAQLGSGDLTFRLDLERRDEVGALAAEFNRMAAGLQDSHQHLEDRVAERTAQLRTLNEASQSVVGDLNLDRVLQTIANLARDLGDAQYAAVLVPQAEPADALPRFITSQDANSEAMPELPAPVGRGLLGLLLQAQAPVRVEHLAHHPAASGFPSGHPRMDSFLGIPIRVHGRSIGGLYLTDKLDDGNFDSEDEQLLAMLAAYAAIAIENARLYGELTHMNEVLEERVQERTAELQAVSAERARYARQLRQVLKRTVRVQEEERKRIAKGVHDGVSQWLMGALFEMQAARVRLPETSREIAQHLSEAQRVLKEVKLEMRRVIYDLHPPLLESSGLVAALRGYINDLETHSHLACTFHVSGEPRRLVPDQALALFRIAQEAMNNAIRHAQVDRLAVSLAYASDSVQLTVADEGRGFTSSGDTRQNGATQPHWGLLSMHERATAVGAILHIDSAPGQGTRVAVVLPTSADGEASATVTVAESDAQRSIVNVV